MHMYTEVYDELFLFYVSSKSVVSNAKYIKFDGMKIIHVITKRKRKGTVNKNFVLLTYFD